MSEDTNRALKATRLYAHFRLITDELAGEHVDASDIVMYLADMSSDQWTGLAAHAGVHPPSTQTIDLVMEIAMAFAEQEEHFSGLPEVLEA